MHELLFRQYPEAFTRDTIETLNIKIESAIQSPAQRPSTPQRRKRGGSRSVAARIAEANTEDFSEQLAAVGSDEEMEEATTPQRDQERRTRASTTPVRPAVIDDNEEKRHLTRLAVGPSMSKHRSVLLTSSLTGMRSEAFRS